MTMLIQELSQRAQTLNAHDRAQLAEELLASLDDTIEREDNPQAQAAWEQEIGCAWPRSKPARPS